MIQDLIVRGEMYIAEYNVPKKACQYKSKCYIVAQNMYSYILF
jgi:hypothetical protein